MMKTDKPLTNVMLDLFDATKSMYGKKIIFSEMKTTTKTPNFATKTYMDSKQQFHLYAVSPATIATLPLQERQAYLNFLQAKELQVSEFICPLELKAPKNKLSC